MRRPHQQRAWLGRSDRSFPLFHDKQDQNSPSNARGGRWQYLLFLAAALFIYFHSSPPKEQQLEWQMPDNERARSTEEQAANKHFSERWIQHVIEHPIQPWDRVGFAEMGLRTQMYLHLLRTGVTPNFDKLEQHMWPFVPGIKRIRKQLLARMAASKRGGAPGLRTARRGIVMSVGEGNVRFALHFLDNLRTVLHSRLPVEIFYYGDEDLPSNWRAVFESRYADVQCIDLEKEELFDGEAVQLRNRGWALKPFAMVASSFDEVMLADADAVFLSSPDDLFDVQGYKETGTLFFHDRDHWRKYASESVHGFISNQLGLRQPSKRCLHSSFWRNKGIYEQESGVVLVNKNNPEVFVGLLFTAWQNTGQIRDQTTYRVFWGDKESYWLAFELADIPYYFVDHYAGGIGVTMAPPNTTDEQVATEDEAGVKTYISSEHPLHFYRLEGSTADAVSDILLDDGDELARAGQPIWFNGGLLEKKHASETEYLKADAWGLLGKWHFNEETELWSFNATHKGTMDQFDLAVKLRRLTKMARHADEAYYAEKAGYMS